MNFLPRLAWARRTLARVCMAISIAALASCGAGDLLVAIPGVGTGGTGSVAGTLTGLGSVIVDGVRYDDSQATLVQQTDLVQNEALVPSAFQVGQYVEVALDAKGAATQVLLNAQIVGPVGAVLPAQQSLQVWGQNVVINLDAAQGPLTVFSGYASLSDVAVQDVVRVYGTLLPDPDDASKERLRATRIERVADAPALARLTGTLRTGGVSGWRLGALPVQLAQSQWIPSSQKPQAGLVVTAVGPWPTGAAATGSGWSVSAVRALAASGEQGGTQRISGAARVLGAGLLQVQGVTVDASAPALAAALRQVGDGAYLSLSGQLDSASGRLVASALDVAPSAARTVELYGAVESWLNAGSFLVRGMQIDARSARFSGGSAADLANGRYVEVSGTVVGNVLRATQITVPNALPDKAVLDLTGLVQSLELATGRFTLLAENGQTLSVAPPAGRGLPAVGDTVEVEGYWRSGLLSAQSLVSRRPVAQELTELKGVIDALGNGQFRLNGQWISASPAQLAALSALRGRRLEVKVRLVGGALQLVEFDT